MWKMKLFVALVLLFCVAAQAQKVVLGCYYNQFVPNAIGVSPYVSNANASCGPLPNYYYNTSLFVPGTLVLGPGSVSAIDAYTLYDVDGLTCGKQYNLVFNGYLRIPVNTTSITVSWNGSPLRVYTSLDDPTSAGFYTNVVGSSWTVTASCSNQIKFEYHVPSYEPNSAVRQYLFHFYLW